MVKRKRKHEVIETVIPQEINHAAVAPKTKGAKLRINYLKEKYGDAVTLIQDIDRKPTSPGAWKDDYVRMIFWLSLLGITEREMANIIGISLAGLELWKKRHADFAGAIQSGKEESAGAMANSVFQSGLGFEYTEEKVLTNRVKEFDEYGRVIKEYTEPLIVQVKKKCPPNITAALAFLKAKHPEIWGDKIEHGGTVNHNHQVTMESLSKKQLKALKKIGPMGS